MNKDVRKPTHRTDDTIPIYTEFPKNPFSKESGTYSQRKCRKYLKNVH